ncbi:MAG TPA: GTPase, partial [Spirochaetia bacterium]
MTTAPKSLRLHVGIFGRTNVGKSSFLNMIAGQDVAIVSVVAGTTTDVVEKPMELLPLGPVVFLDTAGVDDASELAGLRVARTRRVFDRSDVVVLVVESGIWTEHEEEILAEAARRGAPMLLVVNKADLDPPTGVFLAACASKTPRVIVCSSTRPEAREGAVAELKRHLLEVCPEEFLTPPPLVGDLLPSGRGLGMAVLVVPIDLQAPRGRLIL